MTDSGRRHLLAACTAGLATALAGVPAFAQRGRRIKVGAFGPETGPNAVSYQSLQGTAAYFKALNDAGGIRGYTFDYLILDDQYNPALTVGAARRLVEQEEVLALVNPIGTGPILAVKDYLESKRVPSVGIFASTRAAGPYNYLIAPDYTNEGAFQALYGAKNLVKNGKLGIIYQNDDIGKAYLKGAEYIASQTKGLELVAVPFQQGTLDFTPAVGIAQRGGAQTLIMSGTPNNFAPIIKAAESLSYRPQWIAAGYHGSPQVLKQLPPEQTANMVFVTSLAIPGTPDVAEVEAAMKKHYPGTGVASLTVMGWGAGTVFGEAFRRMVEAGNEPSREALTRALNGIKGFSNSVIRNIAYADGPGITSPHIPRPHEAMIRWKGDGFEMVGPFAEVPKVPGQPGQ